MTDRTTRFSTVFLREVRTLRRTRSVWLVALGFIGVNAGAAILTGASGYVPLSLALLTPVELLIPVLAAAIGYRAILADRSRGELAILRTYPITPETFTWGVYCGRLVVFLCIVVGSLLGVGILVPVLGPSPAGLARTTGLDSPLYYFRFVVLSALFAAVMLALMVFVSAVVRNARRGLVGTVLLVIVISIGLDLAIILGLAGNLITPNSLPWYIALSPTSAYRGLVLTYVVAPVTSTGVRVAAPLVSLFGMSSWLLGALIGARLLVWNAPTYTQE